MAEIVMTLEPVAFVRDARETLEDDHWGNTECWIELVSGIPADSLDGLDAFSHAEILYRFHRVDEDKVVTGARHPRGNPEWPKVGIFAQRAKARPNRLGSTIVRIIAREGSRLRVAGLDAIEGTPVIDIKPVMREFLPREAVHQPAWSHELMREYWD